MLSRRTALCVYSIYHFVKNGKKMNKLKINTRSANTWNLSENQDDCVYNCLIQARIFLLFGAHHSNVSVYHGEINFPLHIQLVCSECRPFNRRIDIVQSKI